MVEAMGGHDSRWYAQFRTYACEAFNILRKNADLMLSLFHLMEGSAIEALRADPDKALLKLQVGSVCACECGYAWGCRCMDGLNRMEDNPGQDATEHEPSMMVLAQDDPCPTLLTSSIHPSPPRPVPSRPCSHTSRTSCGWIWTTRAL
jgi:hypothetical protein